MYFCVIQKKNMLWIGLFFLKENTYKTKHAKLQYIHAKLQYIYM